MTAQSFKRYIMPLFAFFIMLAGAKAEVETVSKWQWQVGFGSRFENIAYSKTDKYIVAPGPNEIYFLNPSDGKLIKKIKSRYKLTDKENRLFLGHITYINNDTEFLYESEDRKTIDCYDANDFTIKYSLEAPVGEIIEYEVSKDEKKLVARIDFKEVKVWDLESK